MKLLYDALSLTRRPSGTRSRMIGLVPRLISQGGLEIAVAHGPGLGPQERLRLQGATCLEVARPPLGPLQRWRRKGRLWSDLRRCFDFDLAVVDCHPHPRGVPRIGVVHDLRHLERPGWRGRLAAAVLEEDLEDCRLIHAVSHAVGEELARRWPSLEGRIHRVPNGVDPAEFRPEVGTDDEAVLRRHALPLHYLLCVGHLEARKDPATALRVRELLGRTGRPLPLVFVGQGAFLPEETLAWLRQQNPDHDVGTVLRGVPRADLPALLRGAAALIAPARLEGFGMAPLEALACGTPVVASDIPAHREVLGPAALYAPPGEAEAFATQLRRLTDDHLLRESLVEAGRLRAASFGWDAAAAAFRASLRDA